MAFIEVESNAYIYVQDWGKGQPVLLIHGWSLSHQMFEYQAVELANQGFRVLTMDLRGFGDSFKPWDNLTYDHWCNDIEKVISTLDLKNLTLGGFSMGGAIAMHYVATKKDPRISKLVLLAAAGPCLSRKDDNQQGVPLDVLNGLVKSNLENRPKLYHDFGKTFFHKTNDPQVNHWLLNMGLQCSIRASVRGAEEVRDHDLRGEMESIKIPTKICHGVHDQIVPVAMAEIQHQMIHGSELVRFEESGHGLFLDEREKLNRELIQFVGSEQKQAAA